MGWLTGGGFSLHSLSGAHEPRMRYALSGRRVLPQAHKKGGNQRFPPFCESFLFVPAADAAMSSPGNCKPLTRRHPQAGAGNHRHRVNYELLIPNS